MSARKGVVVVRSGKGDAYRELPLNALVRQVLEEWLAERQGKIVDGASERALFVGRSARISCSSPIPAAMCFVWLSERRIGVERLPRRIF